MSAIHYDDPASPAIRALARFLEDMRPFWPLLVREWIGWASKQFETEGRFAQEEGGWAPLSQAYAIWKQEHYPGKTILIRTGQMRRDVTTPQRFATATELELVIDNEYLGYHQDGTERMPARPVVFGQPLPEPLALRLHAVAQSYADDLVQRLGLR